MNGFSLLCLRLAISYIWLSAGFSKLFNKEFIGGFSKMIAGFASNTHYGFYATFLKDHVLPNSQLFAQLTIWGEILTGVAFLLGFPLILAAAIGILMNLNYFFIATSTPSQFVNILMIFSQFATYANNAGNIWGLSASVNKK